MTVKEFLEAAEDKSKTVEIYDCALDISATETCKDFLEKDEYDIALGCSILAWKYDKKNICIVFSTEE